MSFQPIDSKFQRQRGGYVAQAEALARTSGIAATAGHQRRVAELAAAIAAELGWTRERIEPLRTAALLHDIGKLVVPAEILSKPGGLSENEMRLIRDHASAGADILADIDFDDDIAEMVRQRAEAYLVQPGDVEGLSRMMQTCLAKERSGKSLTPTAYSKVLRYYDYEQRMPEQVELAREAWLTDEPSPAAGGKVSGS